MVSAGKESAASVRPLFVSIPFRVPRWFLPDLYRILADESNDVSIPFRVPRWFLQVIDLPRRLLYSRFNPFQGSEVVSACGYVEIPPGHPL